MHLLSAELKPASVPLSKVMEGLQKDQVDGKHDGKSLRLHTSGDGKTKRLNVHTKLDNIFGFGRAERRREAVNLIKDVLKAEYKISDATATHLISSFQTKPDRLSYADLKALHAHLQNQKTQNLLAADAQITKAMNSLGLSRSEATDLVQSYLPDNAVADATALRRLDQRLDVLIGLKPHSQELEQAMGEVFEMAVGKRDKLSDKAEQSLKLLGPAEKEGLRYRNLERAKILPSATQHPKYQALLQEIGNETKASELKQILGALSDAKRGVSVYSTDANVQKLVGQFGPDGPAYQSLFTTAGKKEAELKKADFDQGGADRVSLASKKWNSLRSDPKAVASHSLTSQQLGAFKNVGLDPQLGSSSKNWIPASSGRTGAVIVKDASNPQASAVIKYEEKTAAEDSCKLSALLTATLDLFGGAQKAPFEISPSVEVKTDSGAPGKTTGDKLKAKLTEVKDGSKGEAKHRVDKSLDKLNTPGKNYALTKQALVEGSDMSKLPVEDKIALVHSPQFAQDMGAVLVMGGLLGLDDHLSINMVDSNVFKEGSNNLSNVMLSSKTGKPVLIDIGNQGQYDDKSVKTSFDVLNAYLKNLKSSDAIQATLQDNALSQSGVATISPVKLAIQSFFEIRDDNLFNSSEALIVENALSDQDKKAFAANFLLGVVNSLEFVASQKANISHAASQNSLMQNPKGLIDDVVSGIGDYSTLKQELKKLAA